MTSVPDLFSIRPLQKAWDHSPHDTGYIAYCNFVLQVMNALRSETRLMYGYTTLCDGFSLLGTFLHSKGASVFSAAVKRMSKGKERE